MLSCLVHLLGPDVSDCLGFQSKPTVLHHTKHIRLFQP